MSRQIIVWLIFFNQLDHWVPGRLSTLLSRTDMLARGPCSWPPGFQALQPQTEREALGRGHAVGEAWRVPGSSGSWGLLGSGSWKGGGSRKEGVRCPGEGQYRPNPPSRSGLRVSLLRCLR